MRTLPTRFTRIRNDYSSVRHRPAHRVFTMSDVSPLRFPVDDPLSTDRKRSPTWFSKLLPRPLALRALAVELRAPPAIVVGESASFQFSIRNRLPVAVSITLPTSQLWGWCVDGIPGADTRGFEPPTESRVVGFGPRERRIFEGHWDGTIRRRKSEGDVWEPLSGDHTLSAFLALDAPERVGLVAESTVCVNTK